MARRARRRGFQRPALAPERPTGVDGLDVAALWRRGEQQEEAFDYEAARLYYREAVRRAGPQEVRGWLERYARFLVERYGQFPEVASWLDDPAFAPIEGAEAKGGLALPRLVVAAAMEVGHPRGVDLDDALARDFNEPESVGRLADRLLQAGAVTEARALLEAAAGRLPPLSRGAELLDLLRRDEDAACEAALAGVVQALGGRDAHAARTALEAARDTWAHTARFKATESQVASAEQALAGESLRADIEAAVTAGDLDTALAAAEALVALAPDNRSDQTTAQSLRDRVAARDRDAALARASQQSGSARLSTLVDVRRDHGEGITVPDGLSDDWALVQDAFDTLPSAEIHGEGLALISALRQGLNDDTVEPLRQALAALPPSWRQVETAVRAAERVARADAAEAQAADQARAVTVRAALRETGPDAALTALGAKRLWADAGLLKTLRHEIEEAKLRHAQEGRLKRAVAKALKAGQLFAAQRALATLEGIATDDDPQALSWRQELDQRCAAELRATPVPPFNLSLGDGPVATAVVDGRMLVVQDRLWLGINLQTRGLAPFQLPEAFPLATQPAPKLGGRDGAVRLLAVSAGRLVAIEQRDGAPPEVVQARSLRDIIRGEGQIVAWALEPDADLLAVLVRKDAGPASLVRVDADTFEAVSVDRHKPALSSLVGVAGAPDALLAATEPEARARRAWAVGRFGEGARPEATWSQDEVAEPVAGLRAAVRWPEQERIFAAYDTFDLFDADKVQRPPSLLVWRKDRIVFASSDLRRRFAPMERIVVDHAWTLDAAAGRLWFAALPRQDHEESSDAMLLGVDARTLRADAPVALEGIARVLAIEPVADGAAALCRRQEGKHAVARARVDERGRISLTIDPLPV